MKLIDVSLLAESELRGDYTRQIAELNNAVASLEAERVEMVEKLSQAKQRGVLLVKVGGMEEDECQPQHACVEVNSL